jgi:hypothetical protein
MLAPSPDCRPGCRRCLEPIAGGPGAGLARCYALLSTRFTISMRTLPALCGGDDAACLSPTLPGHGCGDSRDPGAIGGDNDEEPNKRGHSRQHDSRHWRDAARQVKGHALGFNTPSIGKEEGRRGPAFFVRPRRGAGMRSYRLPVHC